MRPGSVGEKRRIMARAAGGVEDRQPRLSRRIEAAWRDLLQGAPGSLLTVLAVDIEQLGNGCIVALNGRGQPLPNAAEPLCQSIADSSDALGAYSWELFKPAESAPASPKSFWQAFTTSSKRSTARRALL